MSRMLLTLCAATFFATGLSGQTTVKKTPEQREASIDAHRGDFDDLLGDWEFTAENPQYGKFRGYQQIEARRIGPARSMEPRTRPAAKP